MRSWIDKNKYLFYFVLISITCISFVFTNISYDGEYQLAMAYRMIKGDALITQMWEPHQTSAFLCAIIMKTYMSITGTTTGIVLFTQVVGLLIRGSISIWLYKTVKNISGDIPALLSGSIYLLISPKDILTPEFSNMQLWFGTVLFLALFNYFQKARIYWLIVVAISLCMGVFSYPSFVIIYIPVLFLLFKYSNLYKRDVLIVTLICVLIGGTFLLSLLSRIGIETILKCLDSALAVEPSHTVNIFNKALTHFWDIAGKTAIIVGVYILGLIGERILFSCKRNSLNPQKNKNLRIVMAGYIFLFYMAINIIRAENRCGYAIVLLAVVAFGFSQKKLLDGFQSCMYDVALWIGGSSLIATMLLSDHPFLPAVPYMHVLICVSVLPLYQWFLKNDLSFGIRKMCVCGIHIFLILIIFRGVYIHTPIYGRGQICTILDDLALIRKGPAVGIVTDEYGAAKQRDSMEEWKEYIKEGDTIWILGEPLDTLGYLYEDVEVGAPTVMSTPTYTEALLYYWELNPDKYPNVVIMSSGYGTLSWELLTNTWLMEWIETEYNADVIIDGNFWRYYFKNE